MVATQSIFNIGDKVLISPDITQADVWVEGYVVEIEDNPFVGIVITAKTSNGLYYFEKEELFKRE